MMIHGSILNKWVMEEGGKSSQIRLVKTVVFFAQQHCLSLHLFWSCLAGHVTGKDWLTDCVH